MLVSTSALEGDKAPLKQKSISTFYIDTIETELVPVTISDLDSYFSSRMIRTMHYTLQPLPIQISPKANTAHHQTRWKAQASDRVVLSQTYSSSSLCALL